jgi:(p)ppGpp synthase/HD superfamily hydrolase
VERLLLPGQFEPKQRIKIEAAPMGGELIGQVYDVLARADIRVEKLDIGSEQETETLQVACHIFDARALAQVVSELRALPGVRAISVSRETPGKPGMTTKGSKFEESEAR